MARQADFNNVSPYQISAYQNWLVDVHSHHFLHGVSLQASYTGHRAHFDIFKDRCLCCATKKRLSIANGSLHGLSTSFLQALIAQKRSLSRGRRVSGGW